MANPTFKTLQTLDLATIRFGNNTFTREQFDKFVQELKDANFDVAAFSTLQRYKYIVGKRVEEVINTYTPEEFAKFVNELVGEDLWGMQDYYTWDAKTQTFKESRFKTVYRINY